VRLVASQLRPLGPACTHRKRQVTLIYERVNASNWDRFAHYVHRMERVFPMRLRCSYEQLREEFIHPMNVGFVVCDDSPIAYGLAQPILRCDFPGVDEEFQNDKTFYMSSCVVMGEQQKRGISTRLREMRMDEGRKLGYERFTAHIRTGMTNTPHRVIRTFPRWYDFGSFDFVELL